MFVRMAKQGDLPQLESFDEWEEASAARVDAGECAVSGFESAVSAYIVFDTSFLKENFIAYLLVHPDFRRRGLGDALLEYAECHFNSGTVYISTGLRNAAMQGALEKRGYGITGVVDLEGHSELIFVKNLGTHAAPPMD